MGSHTRPEQHDSGCRRFQKLSPLLAAVFQFWMQLQRLCLMINTLTSSISPLMADLSSATQGNLDQTLHPFIPPNDGQEATYIAFCHAVFENCKGASRDLGITKHSYQSPERQLGQSMDISNDKLHPHRDICCALEQARRSHLQRPT